MFKPPATTDRNGQSQLDAAGRVTETPPPHGYSPPPPSPGIEELCSKREELNRQVQKEEEEKARLQHDIRVLTEKLSRVNESLARRLAARADFDRTIAETEAAYMKVRGRPRCSLPPPDPPLWGWRGSVTS